MKSVLRALGLPLLFSSSLSHAAVDPVMLKLHGRWAATPTDYRLGYPEYGSQTVACNDKWIIAGAARASTVQVFNAVTGAWVRRLAQPGPIATGTLFGASCAIIGDLAVIGAPGIASNAGAAYVFNLKTGALVRTLQPNVGDGAAFDLFGVAVAVTGSRIIVGASQDDQFRGSCYVFDLNTGTQLARLQAPDGAAMHQFGGAAAAEGNVAVIGAAGADNYKGGAYAFDLTTFAMIRKIQPASLEAGNSAGYSVAMHQGRVVLGAASSSYYGVPGAGQVFIVDLFSGSDFALLSPTFHENELFGLSVAAHQGLLLIGTDDATTAGVVHVFSLDGAFIQTLTPPDHDNPSLALKFGHAVAVYGNTAVVAEPHESTQASLNGALYLIRSVQRNMQFVKKTAKGDFAPGCVESSFAVLGDSFINADGEIAFASTLVGQGSNGGKDSGVWSMLGYNQGLDLVLKSRQTDGPLNIVSVSKPLINRPDTAIFQAILSGDKTVTAQNNQAIYADKGVNATRLLRTGTPIASLNNAVLSSFGQVVQNRANNRLLSACTLKTGIASTKAENDSALLWHDVDSGTNEAVRENTGAGSTGLTYGQFTGRVAAYHSQATYVTALAGSKTTNQAVFQKAYGMPEVLVAQKNDLAAGAGGARFSAFLGESSDASDTVLFRATLINATTATDEGLWTRTTGGTTRLIMREGDGLPGVPTAKISKFIQFWQAAGQSLVLVQVSGKGVTAASDQALVLFQTTAPFDGQTMVLMREGDPAPGCDSATIGVINRVEVDPKFGHYLVLATLAGVQAGTELTLFRGYSGYPATQAEQTLRRPIMSLRKGQLFDNQPSKIKSILLPATGMTASGAGATGLGMAIQEPASAKVVQNVVITVEFENGVRQVMAGYP